MGVKIEKGNVFSGARAKLKIGSQQVGYATGCSGSEEVSYEPIMTLDKLEVVEWVPVAYNVSFTASRVRLIGAPSNSEAFKQGSLRNWTEGGPNGTYANGIFPKKGTGTEGANAPDALLENLLQNPEGLMVTIEDARGSVFMKLTNCHISSVSWSVTSRGVVGEDVGFVGSLILDEAENVTATI
jgi:hypothetical protein